jgi:hypothetical protein
LPDGVTCSHSPWPQIEQTEIENGISRANLQTLWALDL